MQAAPRILVTGFGPFPGSPRNPTENLVRAIAAGKIAPPPGIALETAVLPTRWDVAPALLEALLARHRPDIAVHFGLAQGATGFRVERTARNRAGANADDGGRLSPRRCPFPGHAPLLRSPLADRRLVLRLRARGLAAALSDDAGNYLCNLVFYRSLAHARARARDGGALFVHVPEAAFADETALLKGAETIIRACWERHRVMVQNGPDKFHVFSRNLRVCSGK